MHKHCCYCLLVDLTSAEYGSAVWDCKNQVSALEAIILGGAKKTFGCVFKTCNEAVRGDKGLDLLSNRRERAKLKWWHYMLYTIKGDTCIYM